MLHTCESLPTDVIIFTFEGIIDSGALGRNSAPIPYVGRIWRVYGYDESKQVGWHDSWLCYEKSGFPILFPNSPWYQYAGQSQVQKRRSCSDSSEKERLIFVISNCQNCCYTFHLGKQ